MLAVEAGASAPTLAYADLAFCLVPEQPENNISVFNGRFVA
ncbi:hypothetical protein ATCR1_09678 [Agrobacterium tumefaciens CCNWGS0286]|jgi:hypothetical protein|nr:hypothetical protein ATCR1_09678 [Agrobacterium tumefaciens CCNWGS0286]EPR08932.1 hypothetical protein L902_15645 [Agrobacterium radiobacter DSM 30147]